MSVRVGLRSMSKYLGPPPLRPTLDILLDRRWTDGLYYRINSPTSGLFFRNYVPATQHGYRSYIEYDVTRIPIGVTVSKIELRYAGLYNVDSGNPGKIMSMEHRSTYYPDTYAGNAAFYIDAGDGTTFHSSNAFPVVGANKAVALASSAYTDLQNHLSGGWWAIALALLVGSSYKAIYSVNQAGATPPPTLYVEYS